MNKNITTFDEWALLGKDRGMERGHHNSVKHMFEMVIKKQASNYSVIDFGCGNGWVVRKFKEHSLCNEAHGIDGSQNMIKKAIKKDPNGTYFNEDIIKWVPTQSYDIVFSMETLYYFENPGMVINKIYDNVLNSSGTLIIGVDHYAENVDSLNWGREFNLNIKTLSIDSWLSLFESAGFLNVVHKQVESKDSWKGTLIIQGDKK